MTRLYVLPAKDQLLLLLADAGACRQIDSGADIEDVIFSARTIDSSLIILINDDGTVAI